MTEKEFFRVSKNEKEFSLIELLVVVTLIAIAAAVAIWGGDYLRVRIQTELQHQNSFTVRFTG